MTSLSRSNTNTPDNIGGKRGRHGMPLNSIFIGIVKDVSDAQYMGRLKVYIPEFRNEESDESSWFTVSYCSPFAGATQLEHNNKSSAESYDGTQTSYGWWTTPPDVNNFVAVFFAGGDPGKGYWFGMPFQHFTNNMVPSVPRNPSPSYGDNTGKNHQYKNKGLPSAEYNKFAEKNITEKNMNRPYAKYHSAGIAKQGLIGDDIRGTSTSSSRRSAPSDVYGILTPGPLTGNKRKGGSSLVFDDKDGNEHVRIRTRSGCQLLLDEEHGIWYAINRDGTSWLQMDADGNVDVFSAKSFSVRAMQDINFHADNNINFFAGNEFNLHSKSIFLDANGVIKTYAGEDINTTANGNINTKANSDIKITASGNLHLKGSDTNLSGTGDVNIKATGNINETGAMINLNGPPATSAEAASSVVKMQLSKKTDINKNSSAIDNIDFKVQKKNIDTITSRMPTFEPCPEHLQKKENGNYE